MDKPKVLYVEDEPSLAAIVKDTLEMQGFEVRHLLDGKLAWDAIPNLDADICLLDIMLPGVDGFALGKEIRLRHPSLPIIFLTAKDSTEDVLRGFDLGGNDYIRKPFSIAELIARIRNLLKLRPETGNLEEEEVEIGKYRFSFSKLSLGYEGEERRLTFREAQIIRYFTERQNKIAHKKALLQEIWEDDGYYNARSLDVYIKKLRDYFAKDPNIQILTLRGVGYRFIV